MDRLLSPSQNKLFRPILCTLDNDADIIIRVTCFNRLAQTMQDPTRVQLNSIFTVGISFSIALDPGFQISFPIVAKYTIFLAPVRYSSTQTNRLGHTHPRCALSLKRHTCKSFSRMFRRQILRLVAAPI